VRRVLPLVVGAAAAAHWAPAPAAVIPAVAGPFGMPTTAPSGDGVVLTFDDGPHLEGTPAVLAELERARAHAIFFVCGEQVERHPEIVREVVSAGHELGLHGYRHQTRRQSTGAMLTSDALRAIDAVGDATGSAPRLYRPPHGVFSLPGLRAIRRLGLEPLLWSKWGRDWERRATPASIAKRVTAGLAARDVILLHDADHYGARGSWRATVASLPLVFDALDRAGLETMRWSAAPTPTPQNAAR
jgi:peptidoglycan/xylan/chitin deacetylase (PgdA/CDA1 family)